MENKNQQKIDITVPDNTQELAKRLSLTVKLLINFGMSKSAEEKQWTLDQIARTVIPEDYTKLIVAYNATHEEDWSEGKKPEVTLDGNVKFIER